MSADARFFTAVYAIPVGSKLPDEITGHPQWVAGSWSHAIADRDEARALLAQAKPESSTLTPAQIDDMAFGYAPSGKIGELREFAAALLARACTSGADDTLDAARYRHVRTLSSHEFAEIYSDNLLGGGAFDDLIDADITARSAK